MTNKEIADLKQKSKSLASITIETLHIDKLDKVDLLKFTSKLIENMFFESFPTPAKYLVEELEAIKGELK
jgi:hypothetical protein